MTLDVTTGRGKVVAGAAAVALVLAVLCVRVFVESRSEALDGDAARAGGDFDAAVTHYGRAAHWYLPGNPWVRYAYDRLGELANAAAAHGDRARALRAFREVRSAIHGTRSTYFPYEERLHAVNERIAALMAQEPAPPVDAGKDEATLRAEHLALLEADHLPDTTWSVLLLLGFFGWLGGLGCLVWRGFDEEGLLRPRAALLWGAVTVAAAALWIVGMRVA
ncbi:MAG TPA: hypothetical protein VG389_08000 [Myxococcota bacterium]|jgi:hypothetical protein|nr:hypothetical protein [Myxococcota bacterium]